MDEVMGGCPATDMKVKVISGWRRLETGGFLPSYQEWDGIVFTADADCRDYDWALVYDDFPKGIYGSSINELEQLTCPQENTILVTCEPPTIKLYVRPYVKQFGYVISTQLPRYLVHPHRVHAPGSLLWCAQYPMDKALAMIEHDKTHLFSTVCSAKQQSHTMHGTRYEAVKYLAEHLPEMDWFGYGVRDLKLKYNALANYRYHLSAENYVGDYHWTDKISDPLLFGCLTFYAGDPRLAEVFPEESFIPIPLGDKEATLAIVREALKNNEYEKRLPAIREARRLLVQKYNMFAQVSKLIHEVTEERRAAGLPERGEGPNGVLRGRHRLRRNPFYAIEEGIALTRAKLHFKLSGRGGYAPGQPDVQ